MRFPPSVLRRLILGFWVVAVVAAAGRLVVGFRIDNSVSVWFAADDPALVEYRQFLADFGHREWMLVVVRQSGEPAARAADRAELVARISRVADVHGVLSAADLPPDAPIVRAILRPDPQGPHEGLLVAVTNDLDRQDGYREAMLTGIRDAAAHLPSIEAVQIAGTAVINGELNRAARRDMWVFFPAIAMLLALLGGLLFRNARDTTVLLGVALGTVVITAGLLVAVGYPLNMVTIMLPTVLIALSVADVVHLIHAFHAARAEGLPAERAAYRAVRVVALPCAGTTLTTIGGFIAFTGSSVLPVFQLGVFGSIGMALAWILAMTGGSSLLAVLWQDAVRPAVPAARLGAGLVGWWWNVVRLHPWTSLTACAASGVILLGLGALRADTDYVAFFRSDARVSQDYRALGQAGFPQNPLTLVVRIPPGRSMASYWRPLDSLVKGVEGLAEVHAVLSPMALVDSPEAFMPVARQLGMLSPEGDQLQLTVMTDYPSSQQLLSTLGRIEVVAGLILPYDVVLTPTGTSLLWAHMDEGVIRTQRQSLAVVSVVCLIILTVLFRSFPLGVLGLLVSFYPVALVLGLMGVWGIPLNMATVLIAGIAVGLAVDDTIHFVHTYQAFRRDGHDRCSACDRAMQDVGVRMVLTSVILIGAFAGMGFSTFMPTAQFGLLSSLTIALALIVDLTVLPLVLSWRARAARAPVPVERWI